MLGGYKLVPKRSTEEVGAPDCTLSLPNLCTEALIPIEISLLEVSFVAELCADADSAL